MATRNKDGSRGADDDQGDSKGARTRQRILDAAAHVLSIKGYSGTRLSEVAEYAEIQAPAIYYHFPSREELIEEVMWSGVANMHNHLQEILDAVDPETSPLDRLMLAVEAHLRHELDLSDYAVAAIRNAGQVPEQLRARQLAEEAKYGNLWRGLIKDAAAEGQLRKEIDLHIAQMLIMGALNWTAEWWTPRRGSLETLIRTAQAMIRSGIADPAEHAAANPPAKPARKRAPRRAETGTRP
jgi:AcrR family transcriptional regulator